MSIVVASRGRPPTPSRTHRPLGAASLLLGGATALAALSVFMTVAEPEPLASTWPVLLAFGVAIAVGEHFRFVIEDERELAPMSLAAALALALTSESGSIDLSNLGSSQIIAVTALSMTLGGTAHVLHGGTARPHEVASRFAAVVVTAVLFRSVPIPDAGTLRLLEASWVGPRWPIAVVMTAVSTVGLLSFLLTSALVVASHSSRRIGQTLIDGLRTGAGLGLALSATGTLIALAEAPLGIVALPLFLSPLVLTQFALRQYAAIRRTYVETVRVLSRLTEVGGFTRPGHSDRVADLCLEIGRDLGLSDREARHLEYTGLLHDIGQVALRAPIPGGATLLAAPADQRRIAHDGAEIVRKTGVPTEVAEAIEEQATPYRVVREQRQELPLASRIVKVANAYDDLVGGSITPRRREAAVERIHLGLGYEYDPRVVAALVRVLARQTKGS